ncbi:hypothetical protein MKZ38_008301 [Zalerion maritima]|uniref:Uncharacterized protein n=1 Tax=Zalerion maritima TaxID=339359 RepID=A0AAD5WMI8_9PEZI|nr:hypothetical protein MKZ38_008301 [Zalerion maritima]
MRRRSILSLPLLAGLVHWVEVQAQSDDDDDGDDNEDDAAAAAAAAATTSSSSSSSPTTRRPEELIGYTFVSAYDEYQAWYCWPGSTWTTLGTYGRCCTTGPVNCLIATECLDTSLLVGPDSEQVETCAGTGFQTVCVEGTIYEDEREMGTKGQDGDGDGTVVMNYDCWPKWTGGDWDATRTVEALLTGSDGASAATAPESGTAAEAPASTAAEGPVETSPAPTSVSQGSSNPGGGGTFSTGELVGIVMGAIAGVLVIVLALAVFYHMRKKNMEHMLQMQQAGLAPASAGGAGMMSTGMRGGGGGGGGGGGHAQHSPHHHLSMASTGYPSGGGGAFPMEYPRREGGLRHEIGPSERHAQGYPSEVGGLDTWNLGSGGSRSPNQGVGHGSGGGNGYGEGGDVDYRIASPKTPTQ